jgi:hypothetical protein
MIDLAWTRGEDFTLAHREPESPEPDAALSVTDAGARAIDAGRLAAPPDTVVVCAAAALLPLLDGANPPDVAVEGDATALAVVQRWVKRAQSG